MIEIGRFAPSTRLKHLLYTRLLGMNLGAHVSLAYKAMPDLMYPEKIFIGNNSIIGYNTVILTHEYLVNEYRVGDVRIGANTMIGANVTILPGVTIGDNVTVGAGSVVSKDIPDNTIVGGIPAKKIKTIDEYIQKNKKRTNVNTNNNGSIKVKVGFWG